MRKKTNFNQKKALKKALCLALLTVLVLSTFSPVMATQTQYSAYGMAESNIGETGYNNGTLGEDNLHENNKGDKQKTNNDNKNGKDSNYGSDNSYSNDSSYSSNNSYNNENNYNNDNNSYNKEKNDKNIKTEYPYNTTETGELGIAALMQAIANAQPGDILNISYYAPGVQEIHLTSAIVVNNNKRQNMNAVITIYATEPVTIFSAPGHRHFVSEYRLTLAGKITLDGNGVGGGVFVGNGAFNSGAPYGFGGTTNGVLQQGITFKNIYFDGQEANAIHSRGTVAVRRGTVIKYSGVTLHANSNITIHRGARVNGVDFDVPYGVAVIDHNTNTTKRPGTEKWGHDAMNIRLCSDSAIRSANPTMIYGGTIEGGRSNGGSGGGNITVYVYENPSRGDNPIENPTENPSRGDNPCDNPTENPCDNPTENPNNYGYESPGSYGYNPAGHTSVEQVVHHLQTEDSSYAEECESNTLYEQEDTPIAIVATTTPVTISLGMPQTGLDSMLRILLVGFFLTAMVTIITTRYIRKLRREVEI